MEIQEIKYKVKVNTFNIGDHDEYFTLVLSSDFINFEDCIKYCTDLTKKCDKKGWGVVLLIVTKWSEMLQLPTHKTVYVCDKGKTEVLTLEWEECENAYVQVQTVFENDWIEKYGVHENIRLVNIYQEGCTREQGEKIFNNFKETNT